jgi:hypothetical protein|tara:strand:- start:7571 stop:7873 length:303 start_codon:yes stop_codon:yes gene_type:complete
MKLLLVLLAISPAAFAAPYIPYIEYKHEHKFEEQKDLHHIRLGFRTPKNFYGEIGPRTDGTSAEIGYKFKKGAFTFKGKWESSKTDKFTHKLETKIRYDL